MRSVFSALLLLACACGNLSNEDVAFLEAIPQKDLLHVVVPQGDTAQPACAIGQADIWLSAKSTGNSINAGVDGILSERDIVIALAEDGEELMSRPVADIMTRTVYTVTGDVSVADIAKAMAKGRFGSCIVVDDK